MTHLNTRDLDAARATLDDVGGWLLDLGEGNYLVTDDEGTVRDIRGQDFIDRCEAAQQWDETAPTVAA